MTQTKIIDPFAWARDWAQASGIRVWLSEETESTNSIAKNDVSAGTQPLLPEPPARVCLPSLYLARKQTQGRGRGANSWITSEGALLSSWAFALTSAPQPIVAPLAGLALYEAAKKAWPDIAFNLKAPNDLFIRDKKVAGILIETVDQGAEKRMVVGLGLNVASHPAEVSASTSLVAARSASQMANTGAELTGASFAAFLTDWLNGLKKAAAAGLSQRMSEDVCVRLRDALNRHPLLSEPILEVDSQGQIRSQSRTLYWHEL